MATYHAAAAIGESLAKMLEAAAPRTDPVFVDSHFAFVRDLRSPPAQGVTLYLYRVAVSGARHNFPSRENAEGVRTRRALPLDFQYLLTGWSSQDARRQSALLVWSMRTLEDMAQLPGNVVNQYYGTDTPPFRAGEAIQIAFEALSLQDHLNIWEVAKHNMQPSVSIVARAVPIETDVLEPDHGPVQTRDLRTGEKVAVVIVAEPRTHVAPLGLRFWDEVAGELVRRDLPVAAWAEGEPGRRVPGRPNARGIWTFSSLPGMRAFLTGRGDEAYWAAVLDGSDPDLGPRRRFIVEAGGPPGRFLATRLALDLPVRGIYAWPSPAALRVLDSDAPPGAVPLFSLPDRMVAGAAIVRASIRDLASGSPAAHALVELRVDDVLVGRGLADARGCVLVAFPYPELPASVFEAPLATSSGARPSTWRWQLAVRVFWTPAEATAPPVLDRVFVQQAATVLERVDPEAPLGEVTLRHGLSLVLRTTDSPDGNLIIRSNG